MLSGPLAFQVLCFNESLLEGTAEIFGNIKFNMQDLKITSSATNQLGQLTITRGDVAAEDVSIVLDDLIKKTITEPWTDKFGKGLHAAAFEPRMKMAGGIMAN